MEFGPQQLNGTFRETNIQNPNTSKAATMRRQILSTQNDCFCYSYIIASRIINETELINFKKM